MYLSTPGFEVYIASKHMNKAKKSLQRTSKTAGKNELNCMAAGKKNESACKLNILLEQFTIQLKCTIDPFLKNVDEFLLLIASLSASVTMPFNSGGAGSAFVKMGFLNCSVYSVPCSRGIPPP
jgi:hypothetical protein